MIICWKINDLSKVQQYIGIVRSMRRVTFRLFFIPKASASINFQYSFFLYCKL